VVISGNLSGGSGGGTANIHWLVTDQLGTPRMVFDQTGSLANESRHDYLPFGEELFAGTGGRTTAQGYSASDGVRQKFTGYEADVETALNFAQARYHSTAQGRFTSADPTTLSVDIGAPQTLNRYSYVMNDPLNLIDPSGMFSEFDFQEGQGQEPTVTQADIMNDANFETVTRIYTNVWQETGQPLTPLEVLLFRPLNNLTVGRLSAQRGTQNAMQASDAEDTSAPGPLRLAWIFLAAAGLDLGRSLDLIQP
jgi:RHS repeat-associated protein